MEKHLVPGTDYSIYQDRKKFSYGIDPILLSGFARPKGLVLDLGSGTGIIAFRLMRYKGEFEKVYGIEIQEDMVDISRKSLRENRLEGQMEILHMDIKDCLDRFGHQSVDTIYTNPPYIKKGSGLVNDDQNHLISRSEELIDLESLLEISSKLLKERGRLCLVHRSFRLAEIISTLKKYRLEPKRLRFVYPNLSSPSNIFLLEAVKGAREEVKLEPALIVYDDKGNYNKEVLDIYYAKI